MNTKKLNINFKKKGYVIIDLDKISIKELSTIQKKIKSSKIENILDEKKFLKKSLHLQNSIYKKEFHKSILKRNLNKILSILGIKESNELNITSFIHLRSVKKTNKNSKKNFIGLHRETFYSDFNYTKYQINVTIPLLNYFPQNSMRVIEKSHKVPDYKIKTKKLTSEESGIKRFSLAHKLGMPYNPKIILSGINLDKSKRVNLKTNQFMIFSGQLIHGNGNNFRDKIRLSIDFGLIKKIKLNGKKIKNHKHVSYSNSGKYWEKLKI